MIPCYRQHCLHELLNYVSLIIRLYINHRHFRRRSLCHRRSRYHHIRLPKRQFHGCHSNTVVDEYVLKSTISIIAAISKLY